ncbi:MAG: LacI family DNA-binding transcriptional regulator, partial [Clostridiales bacterium]|nr:LacI family DNA-binding transcriptional regulator [Clostridiales bacterium]
MQGVLVTTIKDIARLAGVSVS